MSDADRTVRLARFKADAMRSTARELRLVGDDGCEAIAEAFDGAAESIVAVCALVPARESSAPDRGAAAAGTDPAAVVGEVGAPGIDLADVPTFGIEAAAPPTFAAVVAMARHHLEQRADEGPYVRASDVEAYLVAVEEWNEQIEKRADALLENLRFYAHGACGRCGCTFDLPCDPPCGWADSERTICTSCVIDDAASELPFPPLPEYGTPTTILTPAELAASVAGTEDETCI